MALIYQPSGRRHVKRDAASGLFSVWASVCQPGRSTVEWPSQLRFVYPCDTGDLPGNAAAMAMTFAGRRHSWPSTWDDHPYQRVCGRRLGDEQMLGG
jgi:hypothetical protein